MASRSNKQNRSSQAPAASAPRTYGTPSYTPPSASSSQGRPQAGSGTREQLRAAMARDAAAAAAGAQAAKKKRVTRQANQEPGKDPATQDLSALNAAKTIRKKQARDKDAIDKMSK